MDKYEYKVRADEIKALIAEGEYEEAVNIADTIDWRRVKSVMMLCTISDLYKINRRFQESKDILLLAYEKHPTRLIVYSLCELSIKMEEYVQAIEYYKEFVQIAPKDTGRYILQYRLYEAQDVSLEERIAVLEEFKKRDYREKWAYELAYLYHRIGLSTKCVEECDEMFLWFGEGKYVIKALELKALHEPLNEDQQAKYNVWTRGEAVEEQEELIEEEPEEEVYEPEVPPDTQVAGKARHMETENNPVEELGAPAVPTMELPEVKTVDVGQYNTINLQMALAESMKEILEQESAKESVDWPIEEPVAQESDWQSEDLSEIQNGLLSDDLEQAQEDEALQEVTQAESEWHSEDLTEVHAHWLPEEQEESREDEGEEIYAIEEPPVEDTEEEPDRDVITESLIAPLLEETIRLPDPRKVEERLRETPAVDFPKKTEPVKETEPAGQDTASSDAQQILAQMKKEVQSPQPSVEAPKADRADRIPGARTGVLTPLNTKPSKFDHILSQEYDGQLSLVMPDVERVEKQITGQLSIEDIMSEWEEMKKTNEQKRMEEVRQRILDHTGNLFADFDEATKNGLLEELERAFVAAIMKESGKKPKVKKVILPEDLPARRPELAERISAVSDEIVDDLLESGIGDVEEEPEDFEEPESVMDEPYEESVSELEEPVDGTDEPAEEAGQLQNSGSLEERELNEEELELFGQFAHHRKSKRQIIHTLDNMSLASYTGNVIVTGEEEDSTLTLAKALIKEMQYNDGNFSGKVAKISAGVLNKKDVAETFSRLDNGALIIEKAAYLKPPVVAKMVKALEKDNMGLLIIMIDRKQDMNQLLAQNAVLNNNFNLRVDIEPLDDEALVAYAKQYAEEMEYSIDEFGILALHTRIADRQTSDHEVSMSEVRELVDEAIRYANKKTPKHFMDILLAKRYDEEDMIILREKDFMHY